jgi:hypothetical protein
MGAADTLETLDDAAGHIAVARSRLAEHTSALRLNEVLLDVLRLEPTLRSCLNGTDA